MIIQKTEAKTVLMLKIRNGQHLEIKLLEKRNWFWYDNAYGLANKIKWIDRNRFGYISKTNNREIYYSLPDETVVKNFEFKDDEF